MHRSSKAWMQLKKKKPSRHPHMICKVLFRITLHASKQGRPNRRTTMPCLSYIYTHTTKSHVAPFSTLTKIEAGQAHAGHAKPYDSVKRKHDSINCYSLPDLAPTKTLHKSASRTAVYEYITISHKPVRPNICCMIVLPFESVMFLCSAYLFCAKKMLGQSP